MKKLWTLFGLALMNNAFAAGHEMDHPGSVGASAGAGTIRPVRSAVAPYKRERTDGSTGGAGISPTSTAKRVKFSEPLEAIKTFASTSSTTTEEEIEMGPGIIASLGGILDLTDNQDPTTPWSFNTAIGSNYGEARAYALGQIGKILMTPLEGHVFEFPYLVAEFREIFHKVIRTDDVKAYIAFTTALKASPWYPDDGFRYETIVLENGIEVTTYKNDIAILGKYNAINIFKHIWEKKDVSIPKQRIFLNAAPQGHIGFMQYCLDEVLTGNTLGILHKSLLMAIKHGQVHIVEAFADRFKSVFKAPGAENSFRDPSKRNLMSAALASPKPESVWPFLKMIEIETMEELIHAAQNEPTPLATILYEAVMRLSGAEIEAWMLRDAIDKQLDSDLGLPEPSRAENFIALALHQIAGTNRWDVYSTAINLYHARLCNTEAAMELAEHVIDIAERSSNSAAREAVAHARAFLDRVASGGSK